LLRHCKSSHLHIAAAAVSQAAVGLFAETEHNMPDMLPQSKCMSPHLHIAAAAAAAAAVSQAAVGLCCCRPVARANDMTFASAKCDPSCKSPHLHIAAAAAVSQAAVGLSCQVAHLTRHQPAAIRREQVPANGIRAPGKGRAFS
jgi:hypothetical protein